jgi:hypothetical protein
MIPAKFSIAGPEDTHEFELLMKNGIQKDIYPEEGLIFVITAVFLFENLLYKNVL